MIPKETITGVLLAGGKSSRMGQDKSLMLLNGLPLYMHGINRLKPQVGAIWINANQHLSSYQQKNLVVISDNPVTFDGPLTGFLTGLKNCRTPYLVVVPCDCPFFPENLVKKLADKLLSEQSDLTYAMTKEKHQPVFAFMKKELRSSLMLFLDSGKRKIESWYKTIKATPVLFSDEEAFYNVNTLDDFERIKCIMCKKDET